MGERRWENRVFISVHSYQRQSSHVDVISTVNYSGIVYKTAVFSKSFTYKNVTCCSIGGRFNILFPFSIRHHPQQYCRQ